MKPQIIHGMPDAQYHAESGMGDSQFITRSMLVDYIRCPSTFRHKHIDKVDMLQFNGNSGTSFGTFYEEFLLDDDIEKYKKIPKHCANAKGEVVPWNKRKGQYVIDEDGITEQTTLEWETENPLIMSESDLDLSKFLASRFDETAMGKFWKQNIEQSKKQVTIRWEDEKTGLRLQVRLDNLLEGSYICDLKTSARSIDDFSSTAEKYGYDIQAAMYADAYELATGEKLPFLFAISETTGLMRSLMRILHPLQVEHSRDAYKKAIAGITAQDYESPEAGSTQAIECELKAWQLYKYESAE